MPSDMTSRKRVGTALRRKEPDRVPLDLGGTMASGINYRAYEELLGHLGLEEEWAWDRELSQKVEVSEAVRRRLQVDVVNVPPGGPPPTAVWTDGELKCQ